MLFDQQIELSRNGALPFKIAALGCLIQIIAYASPEGGKMPHAPQQTPLDSQAIAIIRQHLFVHVDFRRLAASFNLS